MKPLNGADAAIGWGLIAALAAICWFGLPLAIRLVVRSIAAALARRRAEREQAREALDERARQDLLRIVTNEHRE